DYSLQWGSPCIDTAPEDARALTDITGLTRPQGNLVDMGAFEKIQTGSILLFGDDPMLLECSDGFTDPGAEAQNDDMTSLTVTVDGEVLNTVPGEYVLTYSATSKEGTPLSITRTVTVEDTALPVITLFGDSTIDLDYKDNYYDEGASAADNCDMNIGAALVTGGDIVDSHIPGTYVTTYDVTDPSGNAAIQITRTVIVAEQPDPLGISSIEELQLIGNDPGYPLNGSYFLTQDIDASGTTTWNAGDGFSPIGDLPMKASGEGEEFIGYFTGAGYSISDLYINLPSQIGTGLFAAIEDGATIEQLTLDNATVVGNEIVGAIAGSVSNSSIINCVVNAQVTGSGSSVGGLVGDSDTGTISKCSTSGSVDGSDSVGGLIGNSNAVVTECFSTASATATAMNAGGLVGSNYGTINDCYAVPSTSADDSAGGLVGANEGSIGNCYSAGPVSAAANAGGLVGYADAGTTNTSFWDIDIAGPTVSEGGLGLSTSAMMQQTTFTSDEWDFETVWGIIEGATYPYLLWSPPGPCDPDMDPPVLTLSGQNPETVECGTTYTDAGTTAVDGCDGDVTANIVIGGDIVGTEFPGTYTITYNVADIARNNAVEVTRTVNVIDSTIPAITLTGENPTTVECGTTYTDA
ncbi:MAG: DUF5011 domain-containing protein, partial [Candidatus Hydrogenedentes bacterium]|nr:DUF5011 domain-containing protein [Candidatus Hydrogenedentota bacterium]